MPSILTGTPARFLIRAAILGAVVAGLIWRVDLAAAARELRDLDPRWLLPGLLAFSVSKAVHAYRWRLLLSHHRGLPLTELFAIYLASNFANAVTPFRAGDVIRIELPRRRYGIPRAELVSNVFYLETMLDGVSFAVLVGAALVPLHPALVLQPLTAAVALLAVSILAATLVVARRPGSGTPAEWRLLRRLPGRWRAAIARVWPQLIEGLASLRSGRHAALVLAVSVIAWIAEAAVYWMLARAFGLDLPAAEAIVVMVAANLTVALPLTPFNVGPYEIAVTEVATALGTDRAAASAYAIGSHVLLAAWIGVTGVVAMLMLNLRPREVLREGTGRLGGRDSPG